MSGRASPFAALTGAEKQLKWLEVQSVRLPYVQGMLEEGGGESAGGDINADAIHSVIAPIKSVAAAAEPRAPAVEPERAVSDEAQKKPAPQDIAARTDFQRTRHKQYDAVIARMRQAEMRAQGYRTI